MYQPLKTNYDHSADNTKRKHMLKLMSFLANEIREITSHSCSQI